MNAPTNAILARWGRDALREYDRQVNTDGGRWAARQVAEARCLGWLDLLRQEITRIDREFHGERCEARRKANQA
jgi:hypothetical protein